MNNRSLAENEEIGWQNPVQAFIGYVEVSRAFLTSEIDRVKLLREGFRRGDIALVPLMGPAVGWRFCFHAFWLLGLLWVTACASKLEPPVPDQRSETLLAPIDEQLQPWLLFTEKIESTETLYRLPLQTSQEFEALFSFDRSIPQGYHFSPDGRYVVLRPDGMLKLIDLELNQEIASLKVGFRLTMETYTNIVDNDVVWSPKSDRFAVLIGSSDDLRTDIVVYDLKTGEWSQLTNNPSRINAPTWSPDGERIAFAVWEACGDSVSSCTREESYWNIAVINSDGSDYRVLTDMGNQFPFSSDWQLNSLCRLKWSPDQAYILFMRYCPSYSIHEFDELFVTTLDSGQTFQLTEFGHADAVLAYSAEWSPDSDFLIAAFWHTDHSADPVSTVQGILLFEANEFTNKPKQINVDGLNALFISWSWQKDYVISTLGSHTLLAHIEEGELKVITEALPPIALTPSANGPISLAGYWVDDGYITQWENRLIKITIPDGEVRELGIEINEGMKLLGGWPIMSGD